ncbi:Fic family protein [Agrococcus sp. Marseille-P2731]|uniref:Fic family protein n=1 Tax=Agrococcus sp. Marseille-P2731 TaxID=1841862 RepID=UPI00135666C1|nr:Fic family protein [Agrococcus sp. Marseille-P2731]
MLDDAAAPTGDVDGPRINPYTPFPSFGTWLERNFESTVVDRYAVQHEALKSEVTAEQAAEAARIATTWAAVNTGAIEGLYQVDRGFTYSVAVSSVAWQEIKLQKGESVAEHIADAVRAYDYVLDAATGAHPVTQLWFRELHEIVTASQDAYTVITGVGPQEQALPKGKYKEHPNNPLRLEDGVIHSYAPPGDTPPEMARLVEELTGEKFRRAHPVLQAAYAHYAFVCIHPFADGNGRVARAVASLYLYRSYSLPLVIFADQKADYIDALEAADEGQPELFVRFISERVIDTVGMVRDQTLTAAVPDVEQQIEALRPLLLGEAGLPHQEIDSITLRLIEVFRAALEKAISEKTLGDPLRAGHQFYSGGLTYPPPKNYRRVPGDSSGVRIEVAVQPPAPVSQHRDYFSATRLPDADTATFAVFRGDGTPLLEASVRDTHPTIAQALVFRAEVVALREFRELVGEVSNAGAVALRKAGYL